MERCGISCQSEDKMFLTVEHIVEFLAFFATKQGCDYGCKMYETVFWSNSKCLVEQNSDSKCLIFCTQGKCALYNAGSGRAYHI